MPKKKPAKKPAKKPFRKPAKITAGLVHYDDQLQPFLLEGSTIRGRMVRLGPVVDTILTRHQYPDIISRLLAEMLVLASMLSVNLKAEGILTIQAKGDGPVKFMVVDATEKGELRGYTEMRADSEDALSALKKQAHLRDVFGKGYLAITLDMGGSEGRYQGIVELAETNFTDAIAHYFTQSQQVDVSVKVAVGKHADDAGEQRWYAGGIMIERLPEASSVEKKPAQKTGKAAAKNAKSIKDSPPMMLAEELAEQWSRACIFLESLRAQELLDPHLPSGTLLFRLFNEDGVWIFDPRPVFAACRCTRTRIKQVLGTLPRVDLEALMAEGKLNIKCQFCTKTESFTPKQIEKLFTA